MTDASPLDDLVRPPVTKLQPYIAGMSTDELSRTYDLDPSQIIKLASNENPHGPSPKALAAMQQAASDVNRYPDQHDLTNALATYTGLASNQIVIGNGSNDVLDLIARVFLDTGSKVVVSQYAFLVYELVSKLSNATVVTTPAKDFGHDLAAMAAAITPVTRIIWIANPNNPTGNFIPYTEIKSFLEQIPSTVIVVLDEAYYEYLDRADQVDTAAWLAEHPNLVIVRTFSKIYGLAGARIGYGLASPAIAELMNRVRQPFNANNIGIAAALASLADDQHIPTAQQANSAVRTKMLALFDELGIRYIPSFANFVTIDIQDKSDLHEQLLRQGIITRPLANYGLATQLRITVGTAEEVERLAAALRPLYA